MNKFVSVAFPSFLQPIVDLFDLLEEKELQGPTEVQASTHENGYSASIVILAVLVIESACNRLRYLRGEDIRDSVKTLRKSGASTELVSDVEEFFVVRDVIAHNHLWELTVTADHTKLISATKLPGYGNERFKRIVDLTRRQTRRLQLDVVPTRIHRQTAIVAIRTCSEVLRFLKNAEPQIFGATPNIVWRSRGSRVLEFFQWADELGS